MLLKKNPVVISHVGIVFLFALFLILFLANSTSAQERRALVIGIDNYVDVPALQKANADANAVAQTLEQQGFIVSLHLDVDERQFLGALTQFSDGIVRGDDVVFFFAGHGIAVDGGNYLLPADVPAASAANKAVLLNDSILVSLIVRMFQDRGARSTILILDACRDNPFEGQIGEDRGLSFRNEPPDGSFIFTSAAPGQLALDRLSDEDPDPNSVFTRIFLDEIRKPQINLGTMANTVRKRVTALAATIDHQQNPRPYPFLVTDFQFLPASIQPAEDEIQQSSQQAVSPAPLATSLPECEGYTTSLPLGPIGADWMDLTGQGARIRFGEGTLVCVSSTAISVVDGTQREIPCRDIVDSADGGAGHQLQPEGVGDWRLWFFINVEKTPRTLEIGLYEGTADVPPTYWIETGVEMCNG